MRALRDMWKDVSKLSPADLALVDEFHTRGRAATIELAKRAALTPGLTVLDVGCGLGGAAARREIREEVGLSDLQLIGTLGVLERLSYHKIYWTQTHYFLFTTAQKEGLPTDTQHHDAVWWFPLDDLPAMLWPEQRRLIDTHRDLFATVWAAPQRMAGLQVDGERRPPPWPDAMRSNLG